MAIYKTSNKTKLYIGSVKIKKSYNGATQIYSSGNVTTYIVSGSVFHSQEFEEGQSVLSPSKIPSKSGYTFLGWSTTASGDILSSLTMGDNPITLYAQFVQTAAWNFSYTGGMQSFSIPVSGLYKLTAYGAKGANCATTSHNNGTGGYGGSAVGYKYLTKGQVIYIGVGGAGVAGSESSTFNGGGAGTGGSMGSGGGATHFAINQNAVLASTSLSNVLMVAGGGGAAGYSDYAGPSGGTGGGTTGGNGSKPGENNSVAGGTGGSQSKGGTGARYGTIDGKYGIGGTTIGSGYRGCGGGGGLYGGGPGCQYNDGQNCSGAGGGSGYIGGVPAITYKSKSYAPSMSNGTISSNGSASVQFIAA